MGVRVGASRRTRHGNVWASAPASWVAVLVLLALPLIVDYWVLKLAWLGAAWLVREGVRAYRRTHPRATRP